MLRYPIESQLKMFEDTNHFDFDDDAVLGTSFTPTTSSTQTFQEQKRNEESVNDNSKRQKLFHSEEVSFKCPSPFKKIDKSIDISFKRTESNKSILELIASEDSGNVSIRKDQIELCSQQTASVFHDGPWKEMTKDFCIRNEEYLYEKFNIKWIKKQASIKTQLVNHKAPFLAAIVQSLDIVDGKIPTVNVTLKDSTGDIQGTILHSLYEEYSNFFTVGSVLVLKQFGVLSAGYNNHCLTITPNNLLTIYHLEVSKKLPEDSKDLLSENNNRTIGLNNSLESFNDAPIKNNCAKKKFNFKESLGVQKLHHGSSETSTSCDTDNNKFKLDQKNSCENENCDNTLISYSQISVKPARKEHIEIWKNLLQDVDTDSLFDDF
ncbi:hypothetical protein NQ314_013817 [Rhamnusium bicolor]|uniref:Homologous recombination OB-fold protein OB-fold domain-containing protein n=1 Tax=Rhamnusium bicolor TaxID=1586634 RepID=A0AAV8X5I3_9CUCU|nr:hypothetical protein NQ314_013817 [Rhamnusium bicolor]